MLDKDGVAFITGIKTPLTITKKLKGSFELDLIRVGLVDGKAAKGKAGRRCHYKRKSALLACLCFDYQITLQVGECEGRRGREHNVIPTTTVPKMLTIALAHLFIMGCEIKRKNVPFVTLIKRIILMMHILNRFAFTPTHDTPFAHFQCGYV